MDESYPNFYDYKQYIEKLNERKNYLGDKRKKEYHQLQRNIIKFESEINNISWQYILKYNIKYELSYKHIS